MAHKPNFVDDANRDEGAIVVEGGEEFANLIAAPDSRMSMMQDARSGSGKKPRPSTEVPPYEISTWQETGYLSGRKARAPEMSNFLLPARPRTRGEEAANVKLVEESERRK